MSPSPRGDAFAQAIGEAIETLNQGLAEAVDLSQLATADAVLRASLPDRAARERAASLVPPPASPGA